MTNKNDDLKITTSSISLAYKLENLSYLFILAIAFVLPISTSLTNIFFTVAIILYYLAGNVKTKLNIIIHNKISFLFLVFCGLFIIGMIYNTGSFTEGLKITIKYFDKFLFGALLFPMFTDEKRREGALNVFLLAMTIVLFLSYFKFFNFININSKYVDEVFKSHIETNFLMAFTSYLVMQKTYASFKEKLTYRWLFAGILLLFTAYVFFDSGRSGYFVFSGLLLLFLWQKFSWKGLLGAITVMIFITITAFLISPTFNMRMKEVRNDIVSYYPGTKTSVGARMDFVKNSFELIKKHPFIGTGTGSFVSGYQKINLTTPPTENPHNEFVYIWVQFGIVGVALLLWIFYSQLRQSHKLPDNLRELAEALVVAFFIGCLANSWLRDTTEGHLYVYFSALIFAALPPKL